MRSSELLLKNFPENELFVSAIGNITNIYDKQSNSNNRVSKFYSGVFKLTTQEGKKTKSIPIVIYDKDVMRQAKIFNTNNQPCEIVCCYSRRYKQEGDKYINLEGSFVVKHILPYTEYQNTGYYEPLASQPIKY